MWTDGRTWYGQPANHKFLVPNSLQRRGRRPEAKQRANSHRPDKERSHENPPVAAGNLRRGGTRRRAGRVWSLRSLRLGVKTTAAVPPRGHGEEGEESVEKKAISPPRRGLPTFGRHSAFGCRAGMAGGGVGPTFPERPPSSLFRASRAFLWPSRRPLPRTPHIPRSTRSFSPPRHKGPAPSRFFVSPCLCGSTVIRVHPRDPRAPSSASSACSAFCAVCAGPLILFFVPLEPFRGRSFTVPATS